MSNLRTAQKHAWTLSRTLMVCVVLFRTSDGYGVMSAAEFDGEADSVVHEYDPFG